MTARWYRFLPERMDGVTSRRPRCRPISALPAVRLTGAAVAGVSGQRRQRLTSQETPQTPPLTSPNASIRRRDQLVRPSLVVWPWKLGLIGHTGGPPDPLAL